jgi:hypothetical protein
MPYRIDVYSGPSALSQPDVIAYFEARKRAFNDKLGGSEAASYYVSYPDAYDKRPDTIFIVLKAQDPETGKDIVFGGRRLAFPAGPRIGTLPFEEGRHRVVDRKKADRFSTLVGKGKLDIGDVIPALKLPEAIRCAEWGGFAIDQTITRRLFDKEEYVRMRESVYKKSLDIAKDAGIDITVIVPGRNNMEHQEKWLKSSGAYEFRRLGGSTRDIFSNPHPEHNEAEILLINTSNKYKLTGAGGILRFNQGAAASARGNA